MIENCVFCQIITRQVDANIVYQDEDVTAFTDNAPAAPQHILIVPNQHIASLNRIQKTDADLLGKLLITARQLAEQVGISHSGYRISINTGPNAGQTVFHLHVHLLGGKKFGGLGG